MSEQDSSEYFKIDGSNFSCQKILQEIKNSPSKEFQLNWIIKHLEEKIYLERELNEISLKYNNLIVDFDQFRNQTKNLQIFPKPKATKKVTVKKNLKPSKPVNTKLSKNIKNVCANVQKIYELISGHAESKKPTSNVSVQTEFDSQSKQIDICEHDLEKKFIRLTNWTNYEMKIGNFQLISYLNGFEIAKFKFHKSAYLKPNSSLTLWSSYSPFKRHHPPNDFEMKSDQMNDENINKLASMINFDSNVWVVLLDTNNNVGKAFFFLILNIFS